MSDRAKQFMPFDALKGYKAAIKKAAKVVVDKKELSEDAKEFLDYKLQQIKKGMMVKVIYYFKDEYIKIEGLVSDFDKIYGTLTIVKTKIPIKDIYDIISEEIKEELF